MRAAGLRRVSRQRFERTTVADPSDFITSDAAIPRTTAFIRQIESMLVAKP
jgi:hypothetical protein